MTSLGFAACGGNVDSGNTGGSGNGNGGGGGTGGDPEAEQAKAVCAAHAAAVCQRELECIPGRDLVVGPAEVCTERMTTRCLSQVTLEGTGRTPEALTACADALVGLDCATFLSVVPDVCKFAGTKKTGEACSDDAQCETRTCDVDVHTGCGLCVPDDGKEKICLDDCGPKESTCPFEGAVCGYAEVCNAGLCYPGPTEGEKCGEWPLFCTYPGRCLNQVCTLWFPQICGL